MTFIRVLQCIGLCLVIGPANAQPITPAGNQWNMIVLLPSQGLSFWQHTSFAVSGKVGEMRHTTEVVNFSTARRDSLSYANITTYDCIRGLYKITEQIWYADWFASGKMVNRIDNSNAGFIRIPKGSPVARSAEYVCSLKGI